MAELPQLSGAPFITDGGMGTTLIFHDGLDLPHFAAFHLLASDDGVEAMRRSRSARSPTRRPTSWAG